MAHMPQLDWSISKKYSDLPSKNLYYAEYVWISGNGLDVRSKTKTLTKKPESINDFPVWNFDGSSTQQAIGKDSEVYLNPVAYYPDPFRPHDGNYLVLCECALPDGKLTPIPSNTRRKANQIMQRAKDHKPWFGLEQEYVLKAKDGVTVLGWPKSGFPAPQGPYYCGVGADNSFGRQVVEAHMSACAYAGITISGINGEVMPGQWEFQVGPCEGIKAGDEMWIARYILHRVCEDFGVICCLDPKPVPGWSGSGCHTNYSTLPMREKDGYKHIAKAVECLKQRHIEHIKNYGVNNEKRLCGNYETASMYEFSCGIADRYASIRIPRVAYLEGKGYLEDRRPASNVDPYVVTSMLVETTVLSKLDDTTDSCITVYKDTQLDLLENEQKCCNEF